MTGTHAVRPQKTKQFHLIVYTNSICQWHDKC